jgi:hypothetical protein
MMAYAMEAAPMAMMDRSFTVRSKKTMVRHHRGSKLAQILSRFCPNGKLYVRLAWQTLHVCSSC